MTCRFNAQLAPFLLRRERNCIYVRQADGGHALHSPSAPAVFHAKVLRQVAALHVFRFHSFRDEQMESFIPSLAQTSYANIVEHKKQLRSIAGRIAGEFISSILVIVQELSSDAELMRHETGTTEWKRCLDGLIDARGHSAWVYRPMADAVDILAILRGETPDDRVLREFMRYVVSTMMTKLVESKMSDRRNSNTGAPSSTTVDAFSLFQSLPDEWSWSQRLRLPSTEDIPLTLSFVEMAQNLH